MAMNNNFNQFMYTNTTANHQHHNNNNINTMNGIQQQSLCNNINMINLPPISTLPLPPNMPITSDDDSKLPPPRMQPIIPILLTSNPSHILGQSVPITAIHTNQSLLPSLSCSNLKELANQHQQQQSNTYQLHQELEQKKQQYLSLQTAYMSLRSNFDNVCDIIKSLEATKQQNNNIIINVKSKLNTISEDQSMDKMEEMAQNIKDRDIEIDTLKLKNIELQNELEVIKKRNGAKIDELKKKNRENNQKKNGLERDIKNLKQRLKKLEKDNKKLANFNNKQHNKKTIEKETLNQLYLNSKRIKEFMQSIKKYGEQYQILKKRQFNLTKCIGKEDNETLKIRMDEFYGDICKTEQSYHQLNESLDIIKTESQGKEFELMTKNQERITTLEKERFVQSSHLDEYVKKNQALQLDLTDREMKLRQTQNEVNFVKQKLNRSQNDNENLMEQLNLYQQNTINMNQQYMQYPYNYNNNNNAYNQ